MVQIGLKDIQKVNTIFVYVYAELDDLVKRSVVWADDYVDTSELSDMIVKITNGDITKQKIMEKTKDCFSFINVLNRMKKVFLV